MTEIRSFDFDIALDVPADVDARVERAVEALGCRTCRTLSLSGPHLCEHGVTPAPRVELSTTIEIDDPALYRRLLEG